jgi:hypothetical protein
MTDHQAIVDVINELGLEVKSEFVPWSRSRNADKKEPSLNWKVTLVRKGREILTTDYGAGCGHCPSYKRAKSPFKQTVDEFDAIKRECETGREARIGSEYWQWKGKPILPKQLDVIHSLISDSDVLNYSTYEDWASNLGYDPDSRKGEAIYRACLEIALKMRNAIGDDGMTKLQEAFQDY